MKNTFPIFIDENKRDDRSDLEAMMRDFLVSGGSIKRIPSLSYTSSGKTRFALKDTTKSKSDPDGQTYIERSSRGSKR